MLNMSFLAKENDHLNSPLPSPPKIWESIQEKHIHIPFTFSYREPSLREGNRYDRTGLPVRFSYLYIKAKD